MKRDNTTDAEWENDIKEGGKEERVYGFIYQKTIVPFIRKI